MTDNRTYDAATRQQLAEAMTMCAELSAENDDLRVVLNGWKAEAMQARAERARLIAERDQLRSEFGRLSWVQSETYRKLNDERMESRALDAELQLRIKQLIAAGKENAQLRAELDEANRRADDAVAAYHVIAARMCGMGWWC